VNCWPPTKTSIEGLKPLLRPCREMVVRLGKTESALVRSLQRDSLLVERVERLMTIPAVGPITALTWALEVGDVQRFSSIKKAISYCGLCGAQKSSANITSLASGFPSSCWKIIANDCDSIG
jgi:transposase